MFENSGNLEIIYLFCVCMCISLFLSRHLAFWSIHRSSSLDLFFSFWHIALINIRLPMEDVKFMLMLYNDVFHKLTREVTITY
jgi:hypothetical protein